MNTRSILGPAWGCFIALLVMMTQQGSPAWGDGFPSNAELEKTNVGIVTSSFEFMSGLRKDESGMPNCQGLEMAGVKAEGSGFVVKENGTVVTNYHVIRHATAVMGRYKDGGSYTISDILTYDVDSDLAIVKMSGERTFPSVTMGDSNKVEPQDPVMAVGNPLGMGLSVSPGQVSQVRKTEKGDEEVIVHTAVLAPGNSGGPLYKGKVVVGVNEAGVASPYGMSGFNIAIPINKVKTLLSHGNDKPVPLERVFPELPSKIIKKAKDVKLFEGTIPAARSKGAGTLVMKYRLGRFDDVMLVLKSKSKNVKILVIGDNGKLLGCGGYFNDGLAPLLLSSEGSGEILIAAANPDATPVEAALAIYKLDWGLVGE